MTSATGKIHSVTSASLALVSEDDDQRPAEQHDRADQLQQTLPDEHAHLLDIVGGADHQLPGLVAVVVREGQALDLGVQVVAQVKSHALRVALRPVGLQEGKHPAKRSKHHDGDAPHKQPLGRARSLRRQVAGELGDAITAGQLEEAQDLWQRLRP